MPFEVEQKFRVSDLANLERRLVELGATVGEDHEQVDHYYRHPMRDFARTDEALRLRRVGAHNYITYKGPKLDTETKTRREIEMPLPAGDAGAAQAAELLAALSFEPVLEVRKHRRHLSLNWNGTLVEVALDQVAEVGEFVELELIADEGSLQAAQATIAALSAQLGLTTSERRSYLEMLIAGAKHRQPNGLAPIAPTPSEPLFLTIRAAWANLLDFAGRTGRKYCRRTARSAHRSHLYGLDTGTTSRHRPAGNQHDGCAGAERPAALLQDRSPQGQRPVLLRSSIH